MKARYLAIAMATVMAFGATPVLADHNSKNGEGWANMPNDIHNTRIETKESNDNEAFRDFVKHGAGSETENRIASDGTRTKTQVKDQKRSRIDMRESATTRSRSNQQSAGARRGGRGKR